MPTEDVVILINAKDQASAKLDSVRLRSMALGKSVGDVGGIVRRLDLDIPGLDGFQSQLLAITDSLSAVGKAAKFGIIAAVAVGGYKVIDWAVDVKGAQEKLNKTMEVSIQLYKDLASAHVGKAERKEFQAGLLTDQREQLAKLRETRDELKTELQRQVDIANQAAVDMENARGKWRDALDFTGLQKDSVEPGKEYFKDILDSATASTEILQGKVNSLSESIERQAEQMKAVADTKLKEELQAIADNETKLEKAMERRAMIAGMSNREMFQEFLLSQKLTKQSREYQLALYDIEQTKLESAENAKKEREQRARDAEEAIEEAKKLEESRTRSLREERVQIRKDLAESKKRSEKDIERIRERIKDEKDRQMDSFYKAAANLQASESRTLIRGGGAQQPAERTATATEKMLEEIRKLEAKAEANAKAAEKRLAEIARGIWTKPVEKVIDG